jgi:DNA-binding transcriptional LysR family regulator
MALTDLNLLRIFVAVFETNSFTLAAARFGHPRSTTSRAISALEASVGATLFQRNTRAVQPTVDGRALYERIRSSLTTLEEALKDLPDAHESPTGVLRITSTSDLATAVLAEPVARFTSRYPLVNVELRFSVQMLDLVGEGYDLALRISGKPLQNAALIARKVGRVEFRLYASPSYLARASVPKSPEDLAAHAWIGLRGAPGLQLTSEQVTTRASTKSRIVCDDMVFAREVARSGAGIVGLPRFLVEDDLAQGALVRVLPSWESPTGNVFLVRPNAKALPARVGIFRQILLEYLQEHPVI